MQPWGIPQAATNHAVMGVGGSFPARLLCHSVSPGAQLVSPKALTFLSHESCL